MLPIYSINKFNSSLPPVEDVAAEEDVVVLVDSPQRGKEMVQSHVR